MEFLGYVVFGEGVFVDTKKVEAIVNWEPLENVTEVQSFLGLVGYYHHFVGGFSLISTPLSRSTRKEVKFVWDEKCEKTFQTLKECLTFAPVLTLLTNGKEFVVYNNAPHQVWVMG